MRFSRIFLVLGLLIASLAVPRLAFADTHTVTVTAAVLAHASDFQAEIVADPLTLLAQDSVTTFTVTYGSHLLYGDQITLEAQWAAGLNGAVPVDIFEYVDGSATNGYGGAVPVIDLVNQKIDWTIPYIPANTINQTVTFQLKTNSAYAGGNLINLPVTAKVISRTVSSATATVTSSYQYQGVAPSPSPSPIPSPSPTPTPVPETSPVPGVTASPTPVSTPAPSPASRPTISLTSLLSTQFSLLIQTAQPSSVQVRYGPSPNSLSQSQIDSSFAREHLQILTGLTPGTVYYVKVIATDVNGVVSTSSIYRFKTALTADQPTVILPTVTFVSANSATLYSGQLTDPTQAPAPAVLVLPPHLVYGFRFQVTRSQSIKKVLVRVKNAQVLGSSTDMVSLPEPNQLVTQLIETQPGLYEGNLITPNQLGRYSLTAQLFDVNGNIVEAPLASLTVSPPLTILDRGTRRAIERAQVQLSYFSPKSQSFELLPPQLFSRKNPDYTDPKGQLQNLGLPIGDYQVKVTAIGYDQAQMDFVLSGETGHGYPQITLAKSPFNFITLLTYFGTAAQDLQAQTHLFLQTLSGSTRFFELNAILVIGGLLILTLVSLAARLRIPIHAIFHYLLHRTNVLIIQPSTGERLTGKVVSTETRVGLAGAEVFLIDEGKRQVVAHTKTDQQGGFSFVRALVQHFSLEVMADGYQPIVLTEAELELTETGTVTIRLAQRLTQPALAHATLVTVERAMALLFETWLVLSICFEISFGFVLGWLRVAPFFLFSLLNLGLWLLHLSHLRRERL